MLNQGEGNVNTPSSPDNITEKTIMIPYSRVASVSWDLTTGKRLQTIRDSRKISRPKLEALATQRLGYRLFTEHTVKALELGRVDSVSTEILNCILFLLNSDVSDIFPTATIKNFSKTP